MSFLYQQTQLGHQDEHLPSQRARIGVQDTCDPDITRLGLLPGDVTWSLCARLVTMGDCTWCIKFSTFLVCDGILDIVEFDIIFNGVCVCLWHVYGNHVVLSSSSSHRIKTKHDHSIMIIMMMMMVMVMVMMMSKQWWPIRITKLSCNVDSHNTLRQSNMAIENPSSIYRYVSHWKMNISFYVSHCHVWLLEGTRPGKHTKLAIENGPVEIENFPMKHGDFP